MNIVFLYSEVVSYTEGMFEALAAVDPSIQVDVVYWDRKRLSPHVLESVGNVRFHPRSGFDQQGLYKFLCDKQPAILFISGWMDRDYVKAAFKYKKHGLPTKVVAGIDDQWKGRLRQHLGAVAFKLYYGKLFEYMWVAGKPQYHYAKQMGYANGKIIPNLYSARSSQFVGRAGFQKRFVYLGRFAPEKGTLNLIEAYNKLPEAIKDEWPLCVIGGGSQEKEVAALASKYVQVIPFLQGEALVNEMKKGGVFCAPSLRDQWGVAIHEMALMGFPMLLSHECGAATEFLICGYNGYLFDPLSQASITNALQKIAEHPESELVRFGERSAQLGSRITSEITAYSLLSVMHC